jgi:CheY-like chemotaxis protein
MHVTRLLLVEDQPNDLHIAAETARSVGIAEIEARTSLQDARVYLEKGLQGETPLPDGIVLDLDLGYESGYELLRFWHSTPGLAKIPMVIWTLLGEEQREICNLFKVNAYVSKWEGIKAFRDALAALDSTSPT